MYYGEIKNCDIANGIGVRVTLFVSGCRNACKNCFQPQTWNFNYGEPFTKETEDYILGLLNSKVSEVVLKFLNNTLNYQVKDGTFYE